jgi:hypothetical protein
VDSTDADHDQQRLSGKDLVVRFHPVQDPSMRQKIHSCFISYRHPASSGGREEKLIRHVFRAIKDHLEVYTHEYAIYFDEHRLVPGYQYDEKLAQAICQSACMVIVYWPSYLESDYCRKELHTMLSIEKERRSLLASELHGCRLFVPIILRGKFEDLPTEVRDGCQYLDYTAQATLPDLNIGDDPTMSEQLYRIAEELSPNFGDGLKDQAAAWA